MTGLVAKAVLDMTRRTHSGFTSARSATTTRLRSVEESTSLLVPPREGGASASVRLQRRGPLIFRARGEEIDTLAAQACPSRVPGITAASGLRRLRRVIPLTHRRLCPVVTFVTGHLKYGTINLNWQQLAAAQLRPSSSTWGCTASA